MMINLYILLQEIVPDGVIEKAFSTNPDTVYAVLVGFLFVMIIIAIFIVRALFKRLNQREEKFDMMSEKLQQIVKENTQATISNTAMNQSLASTITDLKTIIISNLK